MVDGTSSVNDRNAYFYGKNRGFSIHPNISEDKFSLKKIVSCRCLCSAPLIRQWYNSIMHSKKAKDNKKNTKPRVCLPIEGQQQHRTP